MNDTAITRLAGAIVVDTSHPLNKFFTLLPSSRRYRVLTWTKAYLKKKHRPHRHHSAEQTVTLPLPISVAL